MRPCDLVERHVVDLVRDQRLVGLLGRHRELGEARGAEAEPLQLLDVRLAIEVVHLVADLPERVAGVALAVRRAHRRQHLGERRVAVPEVLELDQLRDQRVELAFVLGRRHQEEDAVEVALLRHDALLAQIVGDHGRGHAEVEVLAGLAVDARRQQRQLVRVDHRIAVGVAGVAVPLALRDRKFQHCCSRLITSVGRSSQATSVTSSVNCEPRIVTTSGTKGSKNHCSSASGRSSRSSGRIRAASCAPRCRARCSDPTASRRPCPRGPWR